MFVMCKILCPPSMESRSMCTVDNLWLESLATAFQLLMPLERGSLLVQNLGRKKKMVQLMR